MKATHVPDSLITANELLTINDANLADINVSDLLQRAPLFAALQAAESSNGTQHKYVKEVTAPTVGFRAENAGRAHSKSGDSAVTINLKLLDASFHVDADLADQYGRGGAAGLISRETVRHLRAAFKAAEKQLINGTGNDADGYNGLTDSDGLNQLADEMVHGAGGTGNRTSIWGIRTLPDESATTLIVGNHGNIQMRDSVFQFKADASGDQMPCYFTHISAYLGLQIGNKYDVGRVANVGTGATVDDDLITQLLELFPEDAPPTYIVMNKRSQFQLQRSRTATSPTGQPAPIPNSAFNIPIIVTDSITNSESAVA